MAKKSTRSNLSIMRRLGLIGKGIFNAMTLKQARDAFMAQSAISKHADGKQRPKDYDRKRKVRRKMAKESRRINRR